MRLSWGSQASPAGALAASAVAPFALPATTLLHQPPSLFASPAAKSPAVTPAALPKLDFCPWFWTTFGCNPANKSRNKISCTAQMHRPLKPKEKTDLAALVARLQQNAKYAGIAVR